MLLILFHIGISERWNESVETFHKLFGGKLFSDELLPQRVSKLAAINQRRYLEDAMHNHLVTSSSGSFDPWDTVLYRHALDIFRSYQQIH